MHTQRQEKLQKKLGAVSLQRPSNPHKQRLKTKENRELIDNNFGKPCPSPHSQTSRRESISPDPTTLPKKLLQYRHNTTREPPGTPAQ